MNSVLVGSVVVGLLILTFALVKRSRVGTTPAGGTTIANSPSVTQPVPPSGTTASVATVTPGIPQGKLVKKITITKDTTNQETDPTGDIAGWRTFQVAEVYAYTAERKLTSADFSDASLSATIGYAAAYPGSKAIDSNPNTFSHTNQDARVGTLTLVLKDAMKLTRVEVLNRQDCCYGRLAGAKIVMEDDSGVVVWSGVLAGAKDIQLFNIA